MTKENFDSLSKDEQRSLRIGATVLRKILDDVERVDVCDDGSLIFQVADEEGRFFKLTGLKESPQKHDV